MVEFLPSKIKIKIKLARQEPVEILAAFKPTLGGIWDREVLGDKVVVVRPKIWIVRKIWVVRQKAHNTVVWNVWDSSWTRYRTWMADLVMFFKLLLNFFKVL